MSLENCEMEKKRTKKTDKNVINQVTPVLEENVVLHDSESLAVPKIPKKRGRKPKGGKIVKQPIKNDKDEDNKPNIILHLKCSISDINDNIFSLTNPLSETNSSEKVDGFSFNNNKELPYDFIKSTENNKNNTNNTNNTNNKNNNNIILENNERYMTHSQNVDIYQDECENVKDIWKKLTELENCLHNNDVSDKKSACFWDTCDFDNPPIYIPRYKINDVYHVYGCFCSPECACAFLMKENIDTASKFERYHLLNHIYCKIYNYEKNIKPAPNPFYTLNKYYGNLTIQEYRKLLKNERLLLVVDKPLTRQLPELHQDNDDFIINNNSIPSASKYKLRRNVTKQTKNSILTENFGIK
jgi:hypothetical protein